MAELCLVLLPNGWNFILLLKSSIPGYLKSARPRTPDTNYHTRIHQECQTQGPKHKLPYQDTSTVSDPGSQTQTTIPGYINSVRPRVPNTNYHTRIHQQCQTQGPKHKLPYQDTSRVPDPGSQTQTTIPGYINSVRPRVPDTNYHTRIHQQCQTQGPRHKLPYQDTSTVSDPGSQTQTTIPGYINSVRPRVPNTNYHTRIHQQCQTQGPKHKLPYQDTSTVPDPGPQTQTTTPGYIKSARPRVPDTNYHTRIHQQCQTQGPRHKLPYQDTSTVPDPGSQTQTTIPGYINSVRPRVPDTNYHTRIHQQCQTQGPRHKLPYQDTSTVSDPGSQTQTTIPGYINSVRPRVPDTNYHTRIHQQCQTQGPKHKLPYQDTSTVSDPGSQTQTTIPGYINSARPRVPNKLPYQDTSTVPDPGSQTQTTIPGYINSARPRVPNTNYHTRIHQQCQTQDPRHKLPYQDTSTVPDPGSQTQTTTPGYINSARPRVPDTNYHTRILMVDKMYFEPNHLGWPGRPS